MGSDWRDSQIRYLVTFSDGGSGRLLAARSAGSRLLSICRTMTRTRRSWSSARGAPCGSSGLGRNEAASPGKERRCDVASASAVSLPSPMLGCPDTRFRAATTGTDVT